LQCINIAKIILQRTRKFDLALRDWNKKAVKTWEEFKSHFRDARNDLDLTGELDAGDTQYSANLVQEVVEGVSRLLIQNPTEEDNDTEQTVEKMNNIMAPTNDIRKLQHQLQQQQMLLQNIMQQQQYTNQTHLYPSNLNNTERLHVRHQGRSQSRGRYRSQGRSYGRAIGQHTRPPPPPRFYCWTHGGGTHSGIQCRQPSVGHLKFASFAHRMGGNTNNIPTHLLHPNPHLQQHNAHQQTNGNQPNYTNPY
jgi:hypothetical protein